MPLVRTDTARGVATVLLDSPRNRNALSRRLLASLASALDTCAADPAVRVIVLTGAGPVFCSGADLKEAAPGSPAPGSPASPAPGEAAGGGTPFPGVLMKIIEHRCPVVARVNGAVRAGGIGLMAACDIVVAPDDATFAFSEVRIGVVPAIIAVPVLARMNATAAHEHFLTGAPFGAAEAVRTGLVNRAVPAGELDSAVSEYTSALVKGAPGALAAAKQLRRTVGAELADNALARMEELSARHFASEEAKAGIGAMLAKAPAPWAPSW